MSDDNVRWLVVTGYRQYVQPYLNDYYATVMDSTPTGRGRVDVNLVMVADYDDQGHIDRLVKNQVWFLSTSSYWATVHETLADALKKVDAELARFDRPGTSNGPTELQLPGRTRQVSDDNVRWLVVTGKSEDVQNYLLNNNRTMEGVRGSASWRQYAKVVDSTFAGPNDVNLVLVADYTARGEVDRLAEKVLSAWCRATVHETIADALKQGKAEERYLFANRPLPSERPRG